MFQIIPAIDLLDGHAVRLRQGRYDEVTTYPTDPAELAASWRGQVERLHVVDLEGAKAGRAVQRELVRRVVGAFGTGVQVGGGVRSMDAAASYLELGAERVVVGTLAIREPERFREIVLAYPNQVIVALDAKAGRVATDGWLDVSELLAVDVAAKLAELPVAAVLYTDIERDGTEVGPNVAETARLAREGGLPVIASGGVGTLAHLRELKQVAADGVVGAIVGRALHEERFSLAEAVAVLS